MTTTKISMQEHRDAIALMRAAIRHDSETVAMILSLPVEYSSTQLFNALAGLCAHAFNADTRLGFDCFADAMLDAIEQTEHEINDTTQQ